MIAKSKYKEIVDEVLKSDFRGKIAVDATLGRGRDFIKLIEAVGRDGFVHGFDIQQEAIIETKKLLNKDIKNYKLYHMSHEDLRFLKSADLIVYNLGYLPGSNKQITTMPLTTAASLRSACDILNPGGVILIVQYIGHDNSFEEKQELEGVLKNLDQKNYAVEKREFFNQVNNPPIVYLVERII